MGYFLGRGRVQKLFCGLLIWTNNFCFQSITLFMLYHVVLSLWWWWVFPSDYLVSTQLQLWLICCWGCGCCWAVTIVSEYKCPPKCQRMSNIKECWSILFQYSVSLDKNVINYLKFWPLHIDTKLSLDQHTYGNIIIMNWT